MNSQFPEDREDAALLSIARELCVQLGLEESSLDRVLWANFLNYARASVRNILLNMSRGGLGPLKGPMLCPHFPLLIDDALVLREMMHGRLEPEDWRPLMCSSLIFYKQLDRKRNRKRRLALLPLQGLLVFVALDIVFRLLNYALIPTPYFGISYIVGISFALGLVFFLARRVDRQIGSEANRRTVMLLGKERIVKVLEKIEAIRQSDLAQGRLSEWRRSADFPPSPTARIKNIQALSNSESANR